MKCSVHHKILKLLAGTSYVSLAVVCFRCHVGSPLSVGADPSHFSGWISSAFTVSFRIEINTRAVRPGLPHFKACGSPCNQNFSCYASQFHSWQCSAVSRPQKRAQSHGGRAKQRKGVQMQLSTGQRRKERSVSVIGTHSSLFPPIIPIISTLAFLDNSGPAGRPLSLSGAQHT